MSGERFLLLHLPAFRLERCGYEASELAGIIAEERSAMRIQALTPSARALGLRPTMTAAEARGLVPEIALLELEPQAESRDHVALARAFTTFTDHVAPWGPEGLVLEVSRTAGLFGGEAALGAQAMALANSLGHMVHAALADDPLAAEACAMWSGASWCLLEPGEAAALAPLPMRGLRPSKGLQEALRAVGVRTLGAYARLEAVAVAGRFGREGIRLHRVARGLRASPSPDWGALEEHRPSVSTALGGATSTLQIHFVLPGLLVQLSRKLRERDLAVVRLRIVLRPERGKVLALGLRVGRPTTDPGTLERLVRVRLEGAKIDAPVDEILLEAVEMVPERGWQPGLTDRAEATEPLPDLLARLMDHLGDEAVIGVERADSWRPERAWRARSWPPSGLVSGRQGGGVERALTSGDPVEVQQAFEMDFPLPRPTLLLPRPLPVEVRCDEEGRPIAVREAEGWSAVRRAAGPERLSGSWWSREAWARDYWVVQMGQRVAWLYRSEAQWCLHGWFD